MCCVNVKGQQLLGGLPDIVEETPEKLVIAITLTAAAVLGYYLSERSRGDK